VRHSSAGSIASPVRYAVYDIADIVGNRRVLNVDVKHEVRPRLAHITPSTLTAHRFQTGLLGFQGFILLFVLLKHLQWPAGSGDTVAWWTHSVSLMSDYLISFSCNGSGELVIGVADCNIRSINTSQNPADNYPIYI